MKTAQQLEEQFDITPERIQEIDEAATRGELQGESLGTTRGPGRPTLFDEPMQRISFRETASKVAAIDERAEQLGMRRSDYLRYVVDNDLASATV